MKDVRVPKAALAALGPGVALPLDVDVGLFLDGALQGARFASRISPSHSIKKGVGQFSHLAGCSVIGLRGWRGGARALDILLARSVDGAGSGGAGGAASDSEGAAGGGSEDERGERAGGGPQQQPGAVVFIRSKVCSG